jgi:predicted acetyltransferase
MIFRLIKMVWSSRCYHVKDEKEEDNFDKVWVQETILQKDFVCKVYYTENYPEGKESYMLAYATFTFLREDTVEITGLYKNEELKKIKDLPKHLMKGAGEKILVETLRKAKKRGAKYAILMPLDDGSGKLFKYYYKFGFRCVGNDDTVEAEEILYNDFITSDPKQQLDKTKENFVKCYIMRMDLSLL